MGLKLVSVIFVIYILSRIFNVIGWIALAFYLLTMFVLLPLIYFVNKSGHTATETRAFFRHESGLLTPGIKKRGFFKTLSKVSYNEYLVDDRETNLTSISPFPSKRIEEIFDEIIEEIIKYYVLPYAEANNWGQRFRNTEAFLRKFLKKFISEIVRRMSVVEWNIFFCSTTLDHIKYHIHFLKSRHNQTEENMYFMGSKTENLFVEAISNRLLRSLLDKKYIQCEIIYQFCLGVLSHQVIKRTVEYYCDPVNHNQWIFKYLVERKITRSKLNKQLPHFQYDMSFEDFFKMVQSINDLNEVKQIRQKLLNEIRLAEVLKFTQSIDSKNSSKKQNADRNKILRKPYRGHLLTQRDLKCYSNQLSTLLNTVNTKLKMMTGGMADVDIPTKSYTKSSKRHPSNRRNSKSEKSKLPSKFKLKVTGNFSKDKRGKSISEKVPTINEWIPYETVLSHTEGRKTFKEFLNTTSSSRTIELIEMLNHFQQNPKDQHVIAQGIVKRYIHSSPPGFDFDKQLVKDMEEFLKGNGNEEVFMKAKSICEKELKQRWYPYYILSPHYTKFSKHLSKELNSINPKKDISLPDLSTDTDESEIESDESENSQSLMSRTSKERLMPEDVDEDNPQLLFDFTQSLSKADPDENQSIENNEIASNKTIPPDTLDGHSDEECDEEEDGYIKPSMDEMLPMTGGYEAMEQYNKKIRILNKKIEAKEKAYNACIEVSNQILLSKKEQSKMKLDLCSMKEDLNRLKEKLNKYQHNLSRVNKWRMSVGNWNAAVYEIVLPEPKRGTSLDLSYVSTATESKGDDGSTEDDTKQILVVIMVSFSSSTDQDNFIGDNGWLVKHTLKDFQTFKRELSPICSAVDKISLPKVPQRLFIRRKYTGNDLSNIKECLDKFISFVIKTPELVQSETVFKFFCPIESNPISSEDTLMGPLLSLVNTISDASAKVISMTKIPSKFVQKVLAPRKQSGSVTSLDGESTDSKSDRRNTLRKISAASHIGGSLKHKLRKFSLSKDISMSAFELLEELIQLRKSLTLTRRSMITFVQSFFGKNLTQILTEKVALIKSESTIFVCLQKYRDSFRIDSLVSTQSSMEANVNEAEMKLHPSASAFITAPLLDINESNLQHVNSNSSPTMNKARFYQKKDSGSCENLSFRSSQPIPQIEVEGKASKSEINFNQTWNYSLKCDEAVKRLLWDSVPEYWKTLFGTMSVSDSVGFVFESLQSLEANKALVYRILQSFIDDLLEENDEPLYLTA